MKRSTNYILSIAGFDPSGGAGLLADIKTFEQVGGLGMGVQTANTIQTEGKFIAVNWIDENTVLQQLEVLLNQYTFKTVKIGLIHHLTMLEKVIELCLKNHPKVKIIWDPILSASAGFDFTHDISTLDSVLPKLFLITPNWDEVMILSGNKDAIEGGQTLSKQVKVLLKGGHNQQDRGKDYLIEGSKVRAFNPKPVRYGAKHGSGCVFSAALAANLTKGYPLQKSILRSKRYVEAFLSSHPSLLGKHKL